MKTYEEKKQIAQWLGTWLGCYTQEVYNKVAQNFPKIIEDDATLALLRELHERTQQEREEVKKSILFDIAFNDNGTPSTLHRTVMTHAQSYRDVLYDMYIK